MYSAAIPRPTRDPTNVRSQRLFHYPPVPRPPRAAPSDESPALLARRLEMRVKLLEEEARGGIDLSRFDPKNARFQAPPGE